MIFWCTANMGEQNDHPLYAAIYGIGNPEQIGWSCMLYHNLWIFWIASDEQRMHFKLRYA